MDNESKYQYGNASSWLVFWVLSLGFVLPQLTVFGSAIIGATVLCPVDLLSSPGCYLPRSSEYQGVFPKDFVLSDLVLQFPAMREFAAQELRSGRLPTWQPFNFCGTPFVGWPAYSPFELLYSFVPSPSTLVWMHLAQSFCSLSGWWAFLRRGLGLDVYAAVIISCCMPWIGFLSLWEGYPLTAPICLMPWSFLAVHKAIRAPRSQWSVWVAVTTIVMLLSGALDIIGMIFILLVMYACWQGVAVYGMRDNRRRLCVALATVASGWVVGFLLFAPFACPLIEYLQQGSRSQARAAGLEERPPLGVEVLKTVLVPEANGSSRRGSLYVGRAPNLLESSAGAFAGIAATLWLAPLAYANQRRRSQTIYWTLMAVLSLGWALNLPGVVQLLRLPGLNMLSYNRWVFGTAISILMLAGFGLERLTQAPLTDSRWYLVPLVATCGVGVWSAASAVSLPEPLGNQLEKMIRNGEFDLLSLDELTDVQRSFVSCYVAALIGCVIAFAGWNISIAGKAGQLWVRIAFGALMLAELCWFAAGQARDGNPKLYFPPVAALDQLSRLPRGRVLGVECLPPNVNQFCGLWDVRGYDAVDPLLMVRLLNASRHSEVSSPEYAVTQWMAPRVIRERQELRVAPILDMLNVRYLVYRKQPPVEWKPIIQSDDYWVVENLHAAERVSVPTKAQYVSNDEAALAMMTNPAFDSRKLLLLHEQLGLSNEVSGTVSIREEAPTQIVIDVDMQTAGFVLVADQWDAGWKATLDNVNVRVMRANVALRAIAVPAGKHVITMYYDPLSRRVGQRIAFVGLCLLVCWSVYLFRRSKRKCGIQAHSANF